MSKKDNSIKVMHDKSGTPFIEENGKKIDDEIVKAVLGEKEPIVCKNCGHGLFFNRRIKKWLHYSGNHNQSEPSFVCHACDGNNICQNPEPSQEKHSLEAVTSFEGADTSSSDGGRSIIISQKTETISDGKIPTDEEIKRMLLEGEVVVFSTPKSTKANTEYIIDEVIRMKNDQFKALLDRRINKLKINLKKRLLNGDFKEGYIEGINDVRNNIM